MNKWKKIVSVFVISMVLLVSVASYENATEPSGISGEIWTYIPPQGQGMFFIQNISNYTFLGNEISLGYHAYLFPSTQYVNLSDSVSFINIAGGPFSSMICLTNYTKLNFPYSNPVVSIVNTSISISQPLFKGGTNKNDSFGPNATYRILSCPSSQALSLFIKKNHYACYNTSNISKMINPGNFTFYENITFTITLSLGILHFTSQQFHLDQSWWVLMEYNLKTPNN